MAYAVQDSHHWECDMTKLEMIRFWHALVVAPQPDGPHGPLALAATPHLFRKLLDTFISLRPSELFLQVDPITLTLTLTLTPTPILTLTLPSSTASTCRPSTGCSAPSFPGQG